ncbi:MAG: putative manganese transporter [Pseudomonadota bacterium]
MNTQTLIDTVAISPHLDAKGRAGRYLILFLLVGLAFLGGPQTRALFWETIADAYIAVTVFVAATLLIFYTVEAKLRIDTGALLERHRRWQAPIAAVLGALPGCGGAIMVMTQYSIGRAGFGAVVAVLTSTMGDAAFLLIAKEPGTGLAVMALGIVVGSASGILVDRIHGRDFLRVDRPRRRAKAPAPPSFAGLDKPWIAILAPGIALGVLAAFQIDADAALGVSGLTTAVGAAGALLSLAVWFVNPSVGASTMNRTGQDPFGGVWEKTATDTCFVTVWVILAFLSFEMTVLWTGWDLKAAFKTAGAFVPLVGVLVGFVPGCGPQVLTTGLYLQGVVPLSAQLGNAISNDGDALFPALAVAPRASVIATLYTAVPALIVAYGFFFFREF